MKKNNIKKISNFLFGYKDIIILVLFLKIIIFTIISISYSQLPFSVSRFDKNFSYPPSEAISLKTAFKTWDAQHYLFLADQGYSKNNESSRFYPLYPLTIGIANILTKDTFISSILLSNIFSFASFIFFFVFVKNLYNKDVARTSLLLLLVFPTSFYFALPYSESLFFLLTISFFYYLFKNDYKTAAIISFFIPISRPVGVFIVIPFLYFISKNKYKGKIINLTLLKSLSYLLIPVLGLVTYFAYMYIFTGDFFSGFKAANFVVSKWDVSNFFSPQFFLQNLFSSSLIIHGFTNSIIDRLFFIFFLAILVLVYKKTNMTLFLYTLLVGSVPVFGSFMSYTRYLLLAFPIFIALSKIFDDKRYSFLKYPYIFLCFSLQILFLILHSLNYWVS